MAVKFTIWKKSNHKSISDLLVSIRDLLLLIILLNEHHLCTASPGGRAPSAAVCRTDTWWDECRCGRRRYEGLWPDPGPSSPSKWVDRSAKSYASRHPTGGAADGGESKNEIVMSHNFFTFPFWKHCVMLLRELFRAHTLTRQLEETCSRLLQGRCCYQQSQNTSPLVRRRNDLSDTVRNQHIPEMILSVLFISCYMIGYDESNDPQCSWTLQSSFLHTGSMRFRSVIVAQRSPDNISR